MLNTHMNLMSQALKRSRLLEASAGPKQMVLKQRLKVDPGHRKSSLKRKARVCQIQSKAGVRGGGRLKTGLKAPISAIFNCKSQNSSRISYWGDD